jgi:hypothetical protein
MYGRAVYESDPTSVATSSCNPEWLDPYADWIEKYLRIDSEPWQEREVKDAVARYGKDRFQWLDLFGVA